MTRDSLRATLDNLQVDPESAQDRPYLEAMLRRLGYTETEIREELGPLLEADTTEPAPATLDREYRLVVPARESAFLLEGSGHADAPLESRVQFEVVDDDGVVDEGLEFEAVPEASGEPVEFEAVDEIQSEEASALDETQSPWGEEQTSEDEPQLFEEIPPEEAEEPATEGGFTIDEDSFPVEEDATLQDASLETFGNTDVQPTPKTRVRVKRVRARSRADAESQVATGDRRVIKSVPVDIVERWGDDEGAR